MNRVIFAMVVTATAIFSLTACDKEEEPYVPGPYSWDFGYIRGKLNGTNINLQNEGGQWGNHISAAGAVYTEYTSDGTDSYGTTIPITKGQDELIYGFSFHITPVKVGMLEVTSPNFEIIHSSVFFIDRRDANDKKYAPLKQPLKVNITRADFFGSGIPFIEGEMNGILYNEENLNDSIIVENVMIGVHS